MLQTIKTNVIGTLNMLGLAKRVGARYDYDFYLQLDENRRSMNMTFHTSFDCTLQDFIDINLRGVW